MELQKRSLAQPLAKTMLYHTYENQKIQKKFLEQPKTLKCHVRQNDHFWWYFPWYIKVKPFFSANTGLFENLNIPWYCFFNDLSRKTNLNQIKKPFRAVHRGQRSKKVIFDENCLFQNIYFIFSAESTSKLESIMLPYTLITSYVIDSTIIDHTLGQRSNFVHPIPLSIVFLIFNSYPCLFEFPFFSAAFHARKLKNTSLALHFYALHHIWVGSY